MPVLPVVVPGAAVSPGTSSCNRANVPSFTIAGVLVFAVMSSLVTLVAVIVCKPFVLNVILKFVRVPDTKAPFTGKIALGSELVIAMRSVAEVILFQ